MARGIVVKAKEMAYVGENTVIGFDEGINVEAGHAVVIGNNVQNRETVLDALGLSETVPSELVARALKEVSDEGTLSEVTKSRLAEFLAIGANLATVAAAIEQIVASGNLDRVFSYFVG